MELSESLRDGLLSANERRVWDRFHATKTLGSRPAMLVIDAVYAFVGTSRQEDPAAAHDFRTACGEAAWEAVSSIRNVIAKAREVDVPVIYTVPAVAGGSFHRPWSSRARARKPSEFEAHQVGERHQFGSVVVDDIAPAYGDAVIEKWGASGFFGTRLSSLLNSLDVDTVLVTGGTTSGCVRATVVDAACFHYHVGIIAECTFDRFDISHRVGLMDMESKYGKVISTAEAEEYFDFLPRV